MQAMHNFDLCQETQHPNVELDCRDTVCELRVPYIAPTDWYEMSSVASPISWGTVYLTILSVLNTGSGGEGSV
jgi:hypothetical protein